jgi:hypothetical protein
MAKRKHPEYPVAACLVTLLPDVSKVGTCQPLYTYFISAADWVLMEEYAIMKNKEFGTIHPFEKSPARTAKP